MDPGRNSYRPRRQVFIDGVTQRSPLPRLSHSVLQWVGNLGGARAGRQAGRHQANCIGPELSGYLLPGSRWLGALPSSTPHRPTPLPPPPPPPAAAAGLTRRQWWDPSRRLGRDSAGRGRGGGRGGAGGWEAGGQRWAGARGTPRRPLQDQAPHGILRLQRRGRRPSGRGCTSTSARLRERRGPERRGRRRKHQQSGAPRAARPLPPRRCLGRNKEAAEPSAAVRARREAAAPARGAGRPQEDARGESGWGGERRGQKMAKKRKPRACQGESRALPTSALSPAAAPACARPGSAKCEAAAGKDFAFAGGRCWGGGRWGLEVCCTSLCSRRGTLPRVCPRLGTCQTPEMLFPPTFPSPEAGVPVHLRLE